MEDVKIGASRIKENLKNINKKTSICDLWGPRESPQGGKGEKWEIVEDQWRYELPLQEKESFLQENDLLQKEKRE